LSTSTPLIETKFVVPPRRRGTVVRQRLFDLLDDALNRPLTLIAAPAGFGKTTLVRDWIETRGDGRRAAWLSLDSDDNNPVRFHQYLLAVLHLAEPNIGLASITMLGGLTMPRGRDLATMLLHQLGRPDPPIVLVLDDYHCIADEDIHSGIALLVERMPVEMRVVIATRQSPQLPLARWRSSDTVRELSIDELRFSGDEAALFLRQTMGLTLRPELEHQLEERTEGWIAGLQMAALSLRQTEKAEGPSAAELVSGFSGRHRYVVDYLATEVMRQQSDDARAFLRSTSILDRFNAPLANAMTGRQDAAETLSRLEQANMFLVALDNERSWFRYHQLFADFLKRDLPEAEQRRLHDRARSWFESEGFGGEAIKHALAAKDVDAAIRLVRRHVEDTLSRGEVSTMLAWLSGLPEEAVRLNQDLAGYKAWLLHLAGRSAEAEAYSKVARAVEDGDAEPEHLGMLLAFRAFLALNWGDARDAVPLARQALDRLDKSDSFFESFAMCLLGQAETLLGQRDVAAATLRTAVEHGRKLGNHLIRLDAIGHLAEVLEAQGKLREAIVLCANAAEQYTDADEEPLAIAGLVHVPLGMLYFASDDLSRARHHLVMGIRLCERLGMVYFWLLGKCVLAKLEHLGGEPDEGWNQLAAARELAERTQSPRRQRMVATVAADLELRESNVDAAARSLARAAQLPGPVLEAQRILEARLLLAQHKPSLAWKVLQALEQQAASEECQASLVAINILAALTKRVLRQHAGARERLETAVSVAASLNYRRALLDEGPALSSMLEDVRSVAPAFVSDLLSRIKHGHAGLEEGGLVDPLTKTEFAVLSLLSQGLTNKEIADRLATTLGMTKWRTNQIYSKLSVRNRVEAIARARQLRLL
jgi:LuxR family maltose regulon positive regulatory protein